jgi:hypothetical protein
MSVPIRKQIYINPDIDRRLKAAARARGLSEAQIVRAALERYLGASRASGDPLEALIGTFEDPGESVAERHDAVLYGKESECAACSSSTPPAGTQRSTRQRRRTR